MNLNTHLKVEINSLIIFRIYLTKAFINTLKDKVGDEVECSQKLKLLSFLFRVNHNSLKVKYANIQNLDCSEQFVLT